ncbi:MAG: response regulator transcription factor [Planctomycetia bacterium]|nr:response regulator transcription factor [Planctomycetia bacterium]
MTEEKPHILVVEDEVNLAEGLRYTLEQESYSVTLAHEGTVALELLLQSPNEYDIIVLDIMLPGMSGYTICSRIRELGVVTPIMFLSARTLPEDRAKGFDVGANQYMAKPFELDEFLARIKNMLKLQRLQRDSLLRRNAEKLAEANQAGANQVGVNQTSAAQTDSAAAGSGEMPLGTQFQVGEYTIYFDSMEAKSSEKTVHLTQLEISLLKYFILNENRLISKDELLEKVWKMPGVQNTRAPDQFILRLRKIFEPDPANPVYFLTYRNAGYRFVRPQDE